MAMSARYPGARIVGLDLAAMRGRVIFDGIDDLLVSETGPMHGDEADTSVLLFLAPHLVHMERARDYTLVPDNPLSTLEAFRSQTTIISNTDVRNAEAFTAPEIGGDHFRSSAVFLTQSHPKQTEGNDVHAGTSLDQLYAQRFGQTTPIPSMQLCIENVDQSGGCGYGYSCVYTDSLSWATPSSLRSTAL